MNTVLYVKTPAYFLRWFYPLCYLIHLLIFLICELSKNITCFKGQFQTDALLIVFAGIPSWGFSCSSVSNKINAKTWQQQGSVMKK